MWNWIDMVDRRLFMAINNGLGCDALDSVFGDLSTLGGWTIALVAFAFLADAGRKRFAGHLLAIFMAMAFFWPVHYGVKMAIGRPRPIKAFREQMEAGTVAIHQVEKKTPRSNSFPSGHSALAFFMMTYVGLYRRAYRLWALLLAGLVAFSRVYVGAHFPLDCVAGSLAGSGGGWIAWRVFLRMDRKEGDSG